MMYDVSVRGEGVSRLIEALSAGRLFFWIFFWVRLFLSWNDDDVRREKRGKSQILGFDESSSFCVLPPPADEPNG